jgi:ASC-1-like (ASCH) protein
MPFKYGL